MIVYTQKAMSLEYRPIYSSPLAPRDHDTSSWGHTPHPMTLSSPPSYKSSNTPQRESKYASLLRKNTIARIDRCGTYLRRVRQSGDDRRFEARAEQVELSSCYRRYRLMESFPDVETRVAGATKTVGNRASAPCRGAACGA